MKNAYYNIWNRVNEYLLNKMYCLIKLTNLIPLSTINHFIDLHSYNMMVQCWQEDPLCRPDFNDIQSRLQCMLDDTQVSSCQAAISPLVRISYLWNYCITVWQRRFVVTPLNVSTADYVANQCYYIVGTISLDFTSRMKYL